LAAVGNIAVVPAIVTAAAAAIAIFLSGVLIFSSKIIALSESMEVTRSGSTEPPLPERKEKTERTAQCELDYTP
jgi:hypothetical protein